MAREQPNGKTGNHFFILRWIVEAAPSPLAPVSRRASRRRMEPGDEASPAAAKATRASLLPHQQLSLHCAKHNNAQLFFFTGYFPGGALSNLSLQSAVAKMIRAPFASEWKIRRPSFPQTGHFSFTGGWLAAKPVAVSAKAAARTESIVFINFNQAGLVGREPRKARAIKFGKWRHASARCDLSRIFTDCPSNNKSPIRPGCMAVIRQDPPTPRHCH